jgi:hypothetical protein
VIAQRGEQTFFTRGIDGRTMVGIHGFDKVSMKEKKYSYGIYNLPTLPTSPPISGWHQFQSHPAAMAFIFSRCPVASGVLACAA